MKTVLIMVGVLFFGYVIARLQMYFSPETFVSGYMHKDVAKEMAPDVFKNLEDDKKDDK